LVVRLCIVDAHGRRIFIECAGDSGGGRGGDGADMSAGALRSGMLRIRVVALSELGLVHDWPNTTRFVFWLNTYNEIVRYAFFGIALSVWDRSSSP
jgi:hypothetical protein